MIRKSADEPLGMELFDDHVISSIDNDGAVARSGELQVGYMIREVTVIIPPGM